MLPKHLLKFEEMSQYTASGLLQQYAEHQGRERNVSRSRRSSRRYYSSDCGEISDGRACHTFQLYRGPTRELYVPANPILMFSETYVSTAYTVCTTCSQYLTITSCVKHRKFESTWDIIRKPKFKEPRSILVNAFLAKILRDFNKVLLWKPTRVITLLCLLSMVAKAGSEAQRGHFSSTYVTETSRETCNRLLRTCASNSEISCAVVDLREVEHRPSELKNKLFICLWVTVTQSGNVWSPYKVTTMFAEFLLPSLRPPVSKAANDRKRPHFVQIGAQARSGDDAVRTLQHVRAFGKDRATFLT